MPYYISLWEANYSLSFALHLFLFGILLTYWIYFSRSGKEICYFSSHLTKFFVPL